MRDVANTAAAEIIETMTTFSDQLRFLLTTLTEPATLGLRSPLATPYVLGAAASASADAAARGSALADVVEQTLADLWGDGLPADQAALEAGLNAPGDPRRRKDRDAFYLLELNYLHRIVRPAPADQAAIYHDILHISRATHDRRLRAAMDRFGDLLLARLRPALRLESPPAPPTLYGRDHLLPHLAAQLRAGESVILAGAAGQGKSALAAHLADDWPTPAVFWYTVRPFVNDNPESLLHALATFLQRHNASQLWRHLHAAEGQLDDLNRALALLRADLAALSPAPLLCFDEVDLLQPLEEEARSVHRDQALAVVDEVSKLAPALLVGQRAILAERPVEELASLPLDAMGEWLAARGVPATPHELEALARMTGGNPRLVELVLILHAQENRHGSRSLAAVIHSLPEAAALVPVWRRIRVHLTAEELSVVQLLSVFQGPAPADIVDQAGRATENVPHAPTGAARLEEMGLLVRTDRDEVALPVTLAAVIFKEMGIERREALHAQAATLMAAHGEFTAAAYHWWRSGAPERAVRLWADHQETEIRSGQAGAARAFLGQISARHLDETTAGQLYLLRAKLYRLAGEPAAAVEQLAPERWSDDELGVEAAEVRGRALADLGDRDGALESFQEALDRLARLAGKEAMLRALRSNALRQQADLDGGWREAYLGRYAVENVLGVLSDVTGKMGAAEAHYAAALEAARAADEPAAVSRVYVNLGILAHNRGAYADALRYFDQAMEIRRERQDRIGQETVRSNMALAYAGAGDLDKAIEEAGRALRFFQTLQDPFWIALNAHNLSEYHFDRDEIDRARELALLVMEQEEPTKMPYALFTMGRIAAREGDPAQALDHFDRTQRLAAGREDLYLEAYTWREIGLVHNAQGDSDAAHDAFVQSVDLFRHLSMTHEAEKSAGLLACVKPTA